MKTFEIGTTLGLVIIFSAGIAAITAMKISSFRVAKAALCCGATNVNVGALKTKIG